MSIEKIGKILVAEVIEAICFGLIVFALAIGLEDSTGIAKTMIESLINLFVIMWGILGILTPFIIWLELEQEVSKIFKRG